MNDAPDAGAVYRLEAQVGFKLRLANQKHLEIFARRMPEVTPTQWAALAKLAEQGPISQNQLGRSVGMDAATTKGVVDRLRAKGFVESTPSATDMRRLDISLTEAGAAFATEAAPRAERVSEETLTRLTQRERARLLALLDKM